MAEMSFKSFFSIFSFGNHFVQQSKTIFNSNFGKKTYKEHFCEIILKSGHWHLGDVL